MVLKDVLRRLEVSALEPDTDTETSEEFVAALDKENQTIAKANRKPEALPKVPEDFTTSTSPASSPRIPSEILPLSFYPNKLFNDEDNHNMAIGSRKPRASPKATTGGPEEIAGTISRASSPEAPVKTSTLFIEPLDAKDNHNIAQGNKEYEATSSALAAISETSTSVASISSPNAACEVPGLCVESLDKESHPTTKGKENINDAAENFTSISMESISSSSLTSPANIPFGMPALSVERLEKDNTAMAEGENDTKNAAESFATGPQDQISNLSFATPPKAVFQDLALSVDTPAGSESEAVITSDKSTTPEKPKEEAENLVEDDSITQRMKNRAVVSTANLGDLKSSKPGDGAPAQDVIQDNSEEELTTPARKKKPKNKKKTKKPAAPDMPPSSFNGTVIAPKSSSITAPRNSSITAPINASITASRNSSIATPANVSLTARTSFSLTAPANSSTTAWANPIRKVNLALKHRFGFDEYRDELKCRKHECGKLTNCYDGSTVICPRCGINSFFRYCSLECLLHPDMVFHWAQECGTCSIGEESLPLVDKSTLIIRPAAMRPYIECDALDNPARHRQAVFHSSNGAAGDYFVFNDNSLRPNGISGHVTAIGAGQVIAIVSIVPDYGSYQGHSIFQEILEDCLRRGFSRPDKCLALVDIITRHLVYSHQWSQEVVDCLVFQMRNEFAYEIPQEMLYRFNPMVPVSAQRIA